MTIIFEIMKKENNTNTSSFNTSSGSFIKRQTSGTSSDNE